MLVDGHKVCGSAQRKGRRALLQHGSLLVSQSSLAPELLGLGELASLPQADAGELATGWGQRVCREMGWTLVPGRLSSAELESAEQFAEQRFGQDLWTFRRHRPNRD